jgi:hypothetical protein
MDAITRKKVAVISKYAVDTFTSGDWLSFGQITGQTELVSGHPRLLRALSFGDEDYSACVIEVLNQVFDKQESLVDEVIEHFDIGLWYQQKEPEKYQKLFLDSITKSPDFWKEGYFKLFISHLSTNRERMFNLKTALDRWGVSAFVAHVDIEPSREWRNEVEAGLETMDAMLVVVEPGFKESDWCCQEVGYALGRKVDILPICAGLDPFGFFGKYQGIQVKGKMPSQAAEKIIETLIKKPKHRAQLLQSIGKSFASLQSDKKIELVRILDGWKVVADEQFKSLIERISLSGFEQTQLKDVIARVKAFEIAKPIAVTAGDDLPF